MQRYRTLRRNVYQILDTGLAGDRFGQELHWGLIGLVLLNVLAVILISVPGVRAHYDGYFIVLEIISGVVFTIEYLARLWVAPEYGQYQKYRPWRARLASALTPAMLIDLVAILPFFLMIFFEHDFRMLMLLRLLRFFKIARYSTGLHSLIEAIYAERHALAASSGILIGLVLISASFMHIAEHAAQPNKFGTIPDAMYWAIITLATVGYGDVVPITPMGKLITSLTAVAGLGMVALPVGILSSSFANVVHRRDFVVTWGMVARVPLFQGLNADVIGDLARLLQARTVVPGEVIVRRGDTAQSMYFIASGLVAVNTPGVEARLSAGDFFGENALLGQVKRMATVRAIERSSLLVLEARDVQRLMDQRSDVAEKIVTEARKKISAAEAASGHDIIGEELKKNPPADDVKKKTPPV